MDALQTHEQLLDDLREITFTLRVDEEDVPGVLFLPPHVDDGLPLVFIQHPGTGSKEDYFVTEPGMAWAKRGWACVGLDAPLHGDRRIHDPMRLFRERENHPAYAAMFANEVSAVADALVDKYGLDSTRMGYVGYSLGAMLGVAATGIDGRFKSAALCLVGEGGLAGPASGDDSYLPGLANTAVRIVAKSQDELISRAATEALYNALPGRKDIVWLPGGHFEIGPDVIRAAGDWLKATL